MMSEEAILEAFSAFVPDERFRKFLRVLNEDAYWKRRLFAWQSFVWKDFTTKYPEAPTSFDDVAAALRVCPVHLKRMTLESVPIVYGLWDFSESDLHARSGHFPFANRVVFGPDWKEEAKTRVVPVCKECRAVLDQWRPGSEHPFKRTS